MDDSVNNIRLYTYAQIVLLFLSTMTCARAYAQSPLELGCRMGGSYYIGDLKEIQWGQDVSPVHMVGGILARYNFNDRYGIRAEITYGNVGSSGMFEDQAISFKEKIAEYTMQLEFNFLPYEIGNSKRPISPYILFGGTAAIIGNKFYPMLPFGVGLKFNLWKRVGAGMDLNFRKTFTDDLEGGGLLDDPLSAYHPLNQQYTSNLHNNDWIVYLSIHLAYKIILCKLDCPVYE
jgi:hypothetical protein